MFTAEEGQDTVQQRTQKPDNLIDTFQFQCLMGWAEGKKLIVSVNTINLLQTKAIMQQLLKAMSVIKEHYLFYC